MPPGMGGLKGPDPVPAAPQPLGERARRVQKGLRAGFGARVVRARHMDL